MLVLQVLLVGGYLAAHETDPMVLNPARGGLVEEGVVMAAFCGSGSGKEMLDRIPPDGGLGPWTKGRTVQGDCTVWYHHGTLYRPCDPSHAEHTFDERPCRDPAKVARGANRPPGVLPSWLYGNFRLW